MYYNTFLKLSLIFLTLAFGAESVLACSYGPSTVCEKYERSDLIVVGKIESVKPSDGGQAVVVSIGKTFKGRQLKKILLDQPQSTCDWDFTDDVGKTMLLYIGRNRKSKQYSALSPGIQGRVERMSEDLYWLNGLPASLKRTRLSGTVELYKGNVANWVQDPFEFVKNVAGIKVKVFSDKDSFEIVTDKNGVYELWDIPLGKYQIQTVLPPNLISDLEMEKGSIYDPTSNYDSFGIRRPNAKPALIDIQRNSCGGMDFVVIQKPAPKATS
ncbi:MAG: hypothetical protein WBO10_16265 [Pyrinomonadaceae bacterium]